MKRTILAVVVLASTLIPTPASGQIVVGRGHAIAYGRGMGFAYNRHHFSAFGFAGAYYSRFGFWYPPAPVFPPVSMLTPFGFSPGFLGPGSGAPPAFGWNPVWGPSFWGTGWGGCAIQQPPVIVLPPPIIFAGRNDVDDAVADGGGGGVRPAADPEPMPVNAAKFLVISPKKRDLPPGKLVPAVDRVAKIDRLPLLPPPRRDPLAAPRKFEDEHPDPDAVKEAMRLMKLGREAFARGAYGKASEHFERAARANPRAAAPHFLRAQAAFAAGSYAEAVDSVRAGLVLDPMWPLGLFDPKEPYGASAVHFANHLAELRKATTANPREPDLQFLLGYQLWFIGERAEASRWFAEADKDVVGPDLTALFR
ncbi:MAG TPA: tetratricopeptide repeat protein [Gemmata sp.]|nr:tetratricopeptide repeat protein [Gemmata sp.]